MVGLGFMTLLVSALPSFFFLLTTPDFSHSPISILSDHKDRSASPPSLSIKLPLATDFSALSIGNAKAQLSFSVDPPRPGTEGGISRLMIRLNQSKQIKRVALPAKVDLEFTDSLLRFSDKSSRFWLSCSGVSEGEISATLFYETPEGKDIPSASWVSFLQETPIQSVEEFAAETPFRELGESRWLGPDLFLEKYGEGSLVHRIEMGPPSKAETIDCSYKEWLVFKDRKWEKTTDLKELEHLPIAHLKATSSGGLEIEGWEGSSHIRMKIAPALQPPLKVKGEELFAQLRIRSEKQVSCMLDKQCLILRPNDWILKAQGRWKILRKKEERAAFLEGKLNGELFVLDKIEAKSAVKSISGHYFSAGRAQMVPIEHVQKPLLQKGMGKK